MVGCFALACDWRLCLPQDSHIVQWDHSRKEPYDDAGYIVAPARLKVLSLL